MKLYADTPAMRAKQVLGDAGCLVWVALWVLVGRTVNDLVGSLATPLAQVRTAGRQLGDSMRSAGTSVKDVPMVGDSLQTPFDRAASTGDGIVHSVDDMTARIQAVGLWTGVLVAVVPIVLGLAWWFARRAAFVRQAAMTRRFLDADADLDLFALRAMANQPLARLDSVSHDPVGAWRTGDLDVIRRLAAMELADSGLRVPATRARDDGDEIVLSAREHRAQVARASDRSVQRGVVDAPVTSPIRED